MRNEQHSHTRTQTNARRERWRMSALSEWVPFLTLLSMRPRVNTADQMAERETKREREVPPRSGERAAAAAYFYNQDCLSVALSVNLSDPFSHLPASSLALTFICSRQMGQLPW